jgi:nitrogen regulatory protein PII
MAKKAAKANVRETVKTTVTLRKKVGRGARGKRTKKYAGHRFTSDNQPKNKGRKKGQVNHLTRELKEAIVTAAALHGSDGNGKDELIGYLYRLSANKDPYLFVGLLKAIIPLQVQMGGAPTEKPYQSAEEVRAELERRGLPQQTIYRLEHAPEEKTHQEQIMDPQSDTAH